MSLFLQIFFSFMMAAFSRISNHPNSTALVPHWQDNSTGPASSQSHTYYALCYCILIVAIVFGNVLVCLAVLRERSLQTTTNYLVVSLAVADLLVATLVMPWVVYLEVSTTLTVSLIVFTFTHVKRLTKFTVIHFQSWSPCTGPRVANMS